MWLIVKARRGAEDLAVRVHELVLVSPDVHGVHCPLQQVQALVAGGLQAVLGRQVGPQGAGEARVVTQVATLGPDNKKKTFCQSNPNRGPGSRLQRGKTRCAVTYVDHVRDVVDVVFGHQGVGRRQIEQIVVPRFCALELVFRVLGLSLEEKKMKQRKSHQVQHNMDS